MRLMIFLAVSALGAASALAAEDVGDPQAGFEYAQRVCSGCHGISAETSRVPKATRFREVADRPGMTGTALAGVDRDLSPDHAQYRRRQTGHVKRHCLHPEPQGPRRGPEIAER